MRVYTARRHFKMFDLQLCLKPSNSSSNLKESEEYYRISIPVKGDGLIMRSRIAHVRRNFPGTFPGTSSGWRGINNSASTSDISGWLLPLITAR